jgi:hypothetical protein
MDSSTTSTTASRQVVESATAKVFAVAFVPQALPAFTVTDPATVPQFTVMLFVV